MELIAHRRNRLAELTATPASFGVEVDIRSRGSDLILQHDPFADGERLLDWIRGYRHGTLILNVKEEGLEDRLTELMREYAVPSWFFLDQSVPFLLRGARRGLRSSAVRVSEYEPVDGALTLAGQIDWVWVDCFTRFPLDHTAWRRLRDAGFRLCLVSPELQGRQAPEEVRSIRRTLAGWGEKPDAVCTKLEMSGAWTGEL